MQIQEGEPLSKHSNYKIGGKARYFLLAQSGGDITDAVAWAKKEKLPILILGGGTNILFSDSGFNGLVIKPDLKALKQEGNRVRVGSGASVAEFLDFLLSKQLSGFEWAGGLPGTVGGAIYGNAGAFGGETKDRLVEVTSLSISGEKPEVIVRTNKEAHFAYRNSIFKENAAQGKQEVILAAMFEFVPGEKSKIQEAIESKKQYRKDRHPIEYPNIGSIFKNVDVKKLPKEVSERFKERFKMDPFPVLPTAILVAEAGLKDARIGDAVVSPKHTNFIVNMGHATEKDVKAVMELVRKKIREQFKVELEQEVIFV